MLFVLAILLFAGCSSERDKSESMVSVSEYYSEKWRPQYHFTPPTQWMNDPNGMFYYQGEYHLFYQHYPDSNVWGPMHWGHAVSRDLVHCENLPIALYPDTLGYIFSGSAVVDWQNSSELGTDSKPPIVAVYTYHDPAGEREGTTTYQTQGIAYSLDKGRTWEKYSANPVLDNPGIRDFRDPKVMWHQDSERWIMTLAVLDHIEFYASENLKKWKKLSEFGKDLGAHGGVWECPDLFKMKVEGTDEFKWVLLVSINPGGPNGGSATQYFTGEFDGTTFIPDEQSKEIRWIDYGADNYAGVTWSDVPVEDGRKLFIGWMSNWLYANSVPTTVWRSAMTLPRELVLGSKVLKTVPAVEVSQLEGEGTEMSRQEATLSSELMKVTVSDLPVGSFSLKFSSASNDQLIVGFDAETDLLFIDRTKSGEVSFHPDFGSRHTSGSVVSTPVSIEIFIDRSSVEVFLNEGEMVMTDVVFPRSPYSKLSIEGLEDSKVSLIPINSIW